MKKDPVKSGTLRMIPITLPTTANVSVKASDIWAVYSF